MYDCDYCFAAEGSYLRFVGFTTIEGVTLPLVKLWCGECPTDDTIDTSALNHFLEARGLVPPERKP